VIVTTPSTERRTIHRAWWVALAVLGALVAAAGFRSSTGALIEPLEQEFGWSRTMTSGAVTANLVIYGLTAPFAAALMERLGLRRVIVAALLLVGIGSGLTTVMTSPWQLWVLWGGFVGLGAGAMALVLGSVVANRWFESRRGLVTGLFSAASSTGQLVFLPAIAALAAGPGWRYAALVVAGAAFAIIPVIVLVVADRPADVGVRPYGAAPESKPEPEPKSKPESKPESVVTPTAVVSGRHTEDTGGGPAAAAPARIALQTLGEASHRLSFWLLAGTFFICGWSTNGLIGTHFIPAAHDHGMPPTTAAGLLALIGIFDIAGTVASGWLTDRVDPRLLLVGYYVCGACRCSSSRRSSGRESSRACSSSSSSTGWTGWRPSRRRWRCAGRTSGWNARASCSAGCSPRTWSGPGSRRPSRAGCASPAATTSGRG
jgi:MFS family permease